MITRFRNYDSNLPWSNLQNGWGHAYANPKRGRSWKQHKRTQQLEEEEEQPLEIEKRKDF
jgi:hypothetical protein